MSKVWYCPNCGYEVSNRGRCHRCKQRLVASPLAELPAGAEEDEVGYRLNDWPDRTRGMLIEELIEDGIAHRFEDDELVVAASDEEKVDDLVEEVTTAAAAAGTDSEASPADLEGGEQGEAYEGDEQVMELAGALLSAARRLHSDPTDMEADAEVAEVSAALFALEELPGLDSDTWSAVGRVVRRLLAALGAEEALEEEISTQAGVLVKLLEPLEASEVSEGLEVSEGTQRVGAGTEQSWEVSEEPKESSEEEHEGDQQAGEGDQQAGEGDQQAGEGDQQPGEGDREQDEDDEEALSEAAGGWTPEDLPEGTSVSARAGADETVYELPGWLPEQRAELSLYLEEADIAYEWDSGDLIVASEDEARTEALFDRIEGIPGEAEDEEARYRALEELFAATDRLVNDPASESRAAEVVQAVEAADGPTPVGLDDAQWWSIRVRAKTLRASIDAGANREVLHAEATTLRDLLRALV